MSNMLEGLSETRKWRLMVEAAKRGAESQGYTLSRKPGRGLSNIYEVSKGGVKSTACIRTTRDRWFAFPPLDGATRWRTLTEVDTVIVSAVNSKEDPERVEVYIFPAEEVRKRFDAAYAARAKDGQVNRDGFGMWVNLDPDLRGIAASVGSGLTSKYPSIATFDIADLLEQEADPSSEDQSEMESDLPVDAAQPELSTIPAVMSWTRERIAALAGVSVDAVRVDLKIEY